MKKETEFLIYSKRVAEELIRQGFHLNRTELNAKNPKYIVFIFHKTDKLEEVFRQLTSK